MATKEEAVHNYIQTGEVPSLEGFKEIVERRKKRLTEFSNSGGCGSKVDPGQLAKILKGVPNKNLFPNLTVGIESADDAAVYAFSNDESIVFTNDFHTPTVDDPYLFGRIASANALSDVYAMGAKPFIANAIAGFPLHSMSNDDMRAIMQGSIDVCTEVGVPLAGGHTINNPHPIYGLACVGRINSSKVKRNNGGHVGDKIIITKPIGIGVLSSAFKIDMLDDDGYQTFIQAASGINVEGEWLGDIDEVHGLTDVTGFGLTGHLLEMAKGSNNHINIDMNSVPLFDGVMQFAEEGVVPSGAYHNAKMYDEDIEFLNDVDIDTQILYSDPQTNGGLLITVAADKADEVLEKIHQTGKNDAAIIGEITEQADQDCYVSFIR